MQAAETSSSSYQCPYKASELAAFTRALRLSHTGQVGILQPGPHVSCKPQFERQKYSLQNTPSLMQIHEEMAELWQH